MGCWLKIVVRANQLRTGCGLTMTEMSWINMLGDEKSPASLSFFCCFLLRMLCVVTCVKFFYSCKTIAGVLQHAWDVVPITCYVWLRHNVLHTNSASATRMFQGWTNMTSRIALKHWNWSNRSDTKGPRDAYCCVTWDVQLQTELLVRTIEPVAWGLWRQIR